MHKQFLWTAIFFLFSTYAHAAGEDPFSIAVQQARLAVSFLSLSAPLEELGSLPCLTREARDHVNKMQGTATKTQSYLTKNYNMYVAAVTKPMSGNGKCDGGFRSVAQESEYRRQITGEYQAALYDNQRYFADSLNQNIIFASIDMPDDSEGQKCADKAEDLHDQAKAAGEAVNETITALRVGTVATGNKFAQYTAKNSGLGDDCGNLPAELTQGLIGGAPSQGSGVPSLRGKSINGASTVTGEIKNEKLDTFAGEKGIEAPKFLRDTATLKNVSSARSEREAILAGSPAHNAIGGKVPSEVSEEMQVRALMGKGGGDATVNDSSPLAAMVSELGSKKPEPKPEPAREPASFVPTGSAMSVTADKVSATACSAEGFTAQVYVGGQMGEPGAERLDDIALHGNSSLDSKGCAAGTQSRGLAFSLSAAQRKQHAGKELFVYAVYASKPGQPVLFSRSGSTKISAP